MVACEALDMQLNVALDTVVHHSFVTETTSVLSLCFSNEVVDPIKLY